MPCPLCEQLERAKAGGGGDPRFVAEGKRCAVFLSENQGLPGWCVVVLKKHEEHLADLSIDEQAAVFREVALVGNALRTGLGATRVNYECLGNQVAHVHWHVIPRYGTDPDPSKPVWGFETAFLKGAMSDTQMKETILRIRATLGR